MSLRSESRFLTMCALGIKFDERLEFFGRSLLVADPRFRLVVGSVLSPIFAFSDRSDNPFTLVTRE
jgi:hypothetical protein